MKEKVLEALALSKKFYDEQIKGEEHNDKELVRYYELEELIATDFPHGAPQGMIADNWYGAISWLRGILAFEL